MKITFMVTAYNPNKIDMNKWLWYAKKFKDDNMIEIVVATNNPNIDLDWKNEISQFSKFIEVEPHIKKTRTVIQATKHLDSKWLKVFDPDDSINIQNIDSFKKFILNANEKDGLIEVGYKSIYSDGYFEIGNLFRGADYHAPNYSNIYNVDRLKGILEPDKSFTVWDDYFLATSIMKNESIKEVPLIPVVLTNYYNGIGMTNTVHDSKKMYRQMVDECYLAYEATINMFKSNSFMIHYRNRLHLSQLVYANNIILNSRYNLFFRIKWVMKFSKFIKKKTCGIKGIKKMKIKFIFSTIFGGSLNDTFNL